MTSIVFFTDNTSAKASMILEQMSAEGIPIDAIVIDTGRQGSVGRVRNTFRRMGVVEGTRFVFHKLSRKVQPRRRRRTKTEDVHRSRSSAIHLVDDFNGAECEQMLTDLEPDVVVLGACSRILGKHIIDIPKIGILNAHPGSLPEYRGNDVIRWAILQGDPIGVAIHYVDEGIDTGDILIQETVAVEDGDTVGILKRKAFQLSATLMVDTVLRLEREGRVLGEPQSETAGRMFYRMPVRLRREADRRLRSLEYQRSLDTRR